MRNILYHTICILITFFGFVQLTTAQENKVVTFVSAVHPEGANLLLWDSQRETTFEYWDKAYIRIVIHIEDSNAEKQVHKMLATQGYYKPIAKRHPEANRLVLELSCDRKEILFNGRAIESKLTFHIYVPRYMECQQPGPLVADVEKSNP
ncbi:MAG: hypothetical protein AAFV95_00230 [Bacteroidota bacterium]